MQQIKREMEAIVKGLNGLTHKMEKLTDKIETAEKTKKKTSAVKKATKLSKTKSTQRMSGNVLEIIRSANGGITTGQITKQTGLSKKQVWNIVSRAKKSGKITTAGRGIYIAVQS